MNQDFETIYNHFRKPLLRYIHYKISDEFTAHEILNDVFLKASQSLDNLKEHSKLQSWLYKIATNLIIDHYRKSKLPVMEYEDNQTFKQTQEESTIGELECCLNEFIDQLPKQQAQSLKAIYFDELTQKEYAELNSLNLSTVKSHVKRGKESMKQFFEECCEFERNRNDEIVDVKAKESCCK